MLDRVFLIGLDVLAFVLPVSIAATNIIFFPMAMVWLLGARWTFPRWSPVWGSPEKFFLVYLAVSLLSAAVGLDAAHSLKEIKNKDFYILIPIVMVALVRERSHSARLLNLFMGAALGTAIWGILQFIIGVNLSDKIDGYVFHLPAVMSHWPQPVINLFAMINGRVLGTRGHPLAFAECLLFNWAFAMCFILSGRGRQWMGWMAYLVITGGALLVSQSRGPWIAAGAIAALAAVTSGSRRRWLIFGVCALFVALFAAIPVLRSRAVSILDRSHHSNKERVHMWHAGWQMWKTHPLLGVGPGNVKGISPAFQTTDEKVWGAWGHLHSTYINGLVERGILGLLSFLLYLGSIGWELGQALRRENGDPWQSAVYKASLLGVVGFLISGLTETSYNTAVVMMTFYFVLGIAWSLARHGEKPVVG